jgi:hypothetical protein
MKFETKNLYICIKKTDAMQRRMAMVAKQISLKDQNQESADLDYWLSKTPQERLQAVTTLIRQNMSNEQKMDKTVASKRLMK